METTRCQTSAFDTAARLSLQYKVTIRIYAVDVQPDGWGQSRAYYVDKLPPPGLDLVQVWDLRMVPQPGGRPTKPEVTEVPIGGK